MKKFVRNIIFLIIFLGSITAAFYGGLWVGGNFSEEEVQTNYVTSSDAELGELFEPFFQAWDIVHEQYVDQPVDDVELMQSAIGGLMSGLGDTHSSYMDPETYQQASAPLEGGYTGIGAWVDTSGDRLVIIAPMPDSPAEEAGLKSGDIVVGIDGEDVTGIAPDIVLQSVLGPADTLVVLTVVREGVDDPLDIPIMRAEIEIPVLEARMLENNNIAYINLYQFSINAGAEMQQALEELLAQEPIGVILDLRANSGGYLDAAFDVTSLFIEEGPIMIEEWGDGTTQTYAALGNAIAADIPLVVLVDGGSASASEITAGAIQDRGRGTLIGTTTYGKGSVQNWIELTGDNGAIRVTVARWLTPDGRQINGVGLTPDVEVEYTQEDYDAGLDPQLDKAEQILLDVSNNAS